MRIIIISFPYIILIFSYQLMYFSNSWQFNLLKAYKQLKQPIEAIINIWREKRKCGIKEFTLIPKLNTIHTRYHI